jgi:hypothetical protein
MSKKKSVNMHKFYALMVILQWNLDDLKVTTPRMQKLKDTLDEFCTLLNDECAGTNTLQNTTYFQEITHKIDTLMRKSFDSNM